MSGSTETAQALRRQAEETLRQTVAKEPKDLAPLSAEEMQVVLHELRVHQIELEMQNDELCRTHVELDSVRAEYFNLYDLAPVGYCTISEQGLLLKANLTAAGLLGLVRKALVGKRMSFFIQKEDQDIYYLHHKRLVETGMPQVFELRMKKSDGAIFWAQLVATAALDADGLSLCRMALSDISALKEAEGMLRESEQDFKNLVNSGMALIWTSGRDKAELSSLSALTKLMPLRYKLCNYFNSVWLEFTGRSLEEEMGNGWAEGVHPDDFQRCLDIYVGAFDRQEPFSMEYRLRRHDGIYRWIIDEGCPRYDSRGEFLGYIGHCLDIDGRKRAEAENIRLEAQLRQAQKMESVGLLAGGVAHDFNNKLAIILGYTEMILGKVAPTEPLVADLQEIQKAAEHSADLTRQLLAFARKQMVMPRILDLNDTIEGMLRMLRRLIGENIDLAWQPSTSLWPVKIDPSQIDQILANLCVNARDAIGGVGRLTIETANRSLHTAYCERRIDCVPGEYVLLTVGDDGCGMDQETLTRIFEPFFTTKTFGEGTGLGLATVYGAVRQNNGFIDVDSRPGSGTTFYIYLPRHTSMAVPLVQEVAAQPTEGGLETILLVEDEEAILKMTTRMLQGLGYAVLAANSTEVAIRLAKARAAAIHLLMTDVVMPEMNGRDLAEHLMSFMPQLKCLLMSGYTADIISRQGKLDAGLHFIQKPFSKNELAAKVRAALAGKEEASGDRASGQNEWIADT